MQGELTFGQLNAIANILSERPEPWYYATKRQYRRARGKYKARVHRGRQYLLVNF